jgi:phosphate transport system substrate-binding protein
MRTILYNILCAAAIAALALGCQGEPPETPTKGHVTIVVSDAVAPLLAVEERIFEELYPDAHVDIVTAPDREAIARLFNAGGAGDSITMIVTARPFNAEELEVKKRFKLQVREIPVAFDGVAVIVNHENPLRQLRTTELDSIFRGTIASWDDIRGTTRKSPIALILPDINSADYEVVGMTILKGARFAAPAKTVGSSLEMLQAVLKDPDAIGIVGMAWLKEHGDQVRQVELGDPNAPDSLGTRGKFFSPHPAYVYEQYYPIRRNVCIYSTADNYGVAAGFTSFIASAPGQKIVVNSGLVPATMPVRLVETTTKPLPQ